MDILEMLEDAVKSKNIVTVVYNAGSRPGQARNLYVLELMGDDLRVKEVGAKTAKTYKMTKIASVRLFESDIVATQIVDEPANKVNLPNLDTLDEYREITRATFLAKGWNLIEKDQFFGVAGFFKNGKPRKSCAAAIFFNDPSQADAINPLDLKEIEITGREKPWVVSSDRFKKSRSFSKLSAAFDLFYTEVCELQPI